MASRAQICAVCDAYIAAVGAGDSDGVMALYAAAPQIEDPVGSEPRVGRDAVRTFYEGNAGVPLKCRRIGPITVVGSRAAFQFRIEVDLGETKLLMTSTDVMTFDDEGLILSMTAYPDAEADPDERP